VVWTLLAVVVLAVHNVVGNEVLPDAAYVPVNLMTAAVLLGLAGLAGVSLADLGLDRADASSGLRWGAALTLLVGAVIALGVVIPITQGLFEDRRVSGLDGAGLAYQAAVRIPVGTALFEEVAFRGVLLGLLTRVVSTAVAVGVASGLFGLWHVLPTLSALRVNDLAEGTVARSGAVVGAVLVTACGGLLFCALRLHTGSLLAPILAHTATNSCAIVAAFAVQRMD
jgi:membrane protease YdiL (CAAX protease family)